ncbi:hypothetical protein [uncultured Duncaniella sp.]|uniref:hypothetical protein n=1 Tax=uncultured Duncaniella sp. TaxID=2768039 RepID=UPI00267617DE|nr:hypothetical protein [uncultured Duncaniella sp.]
MKKKKIGKRDKSLAKKVAKATADTSVDVKSGGSDSATTKSATTDWKAKVKNKRDTIVRVLKAEGKYSPEMSLQVNILAQLCIKADRLFQDTMDENPVVVEKSREGDSRAMVSVKEKLFLDYIDRVQKAIKALGMNWDSRDRKTESDDGFNAFLKEFAEDED